MTWLAGLHRDVRDHAQELLRRGWQHDRTSSSNHPRLVWPATGDVLSLPSTPSDGRWLENSRANARRVDGTSVPSRRGPSFSFKKAVGYRPDRSRAEVAAAETVERLRADLDACDQALAATNPGRERAKALRLAAQRLALAERLEQHHQPVPPLPTDCEEVR